jgi:hypothetical protein
MGSGQSGETLSDQTSNHSGVKIMGVQNPTVFYAQQFADNVALLAQQMSSKLEMAVTIGTGHRGEQASPVDQVGLVEAIQANTRFGPMPHNEANQDRRWVLPTSWQLSLKYAPNDLIRQITDPRNALAMEAVAAFNRRKDLTILGGMLQANQTGKSGTTSTPFLAGNVVSVNTGGTGSKLNVAKLREMKRKLMAHDIDLNNEELYIAVDSFNYDSLFAEIQVTSKDYNPGRDGTPVMVDGRIDRFLGVNFIHCERLLSFNGTDDGAGTSTPLPMWCKSGVYFGKWQDTTTRIDERQDLEDIPWQLYAKGTFGACRLEEKKVVFAWGRT